MSVAAEIIANYRRAYRAVRRAPPVLVPEPEPEPKPEPPAAPAPVGGLLYPPIRAIVLAVAREYGISEVDIYSTRRERKVLRPRHLAMYLAKTLTLRSLPEIGRRMGGRDHTTVLHAVRKIERELGCALAITADARLDDVVRAHRLALDEAARWAPRQITMAAELWNAGRDTADIARFTGFPERVIWRRLDEIKARARELRAPIPATA